MNHFLNYIKKHWLLLLFGTAAFGWYLHLTYSGNKWCDCAKTEQYKDGTVRSTSGSRGFYRYYHK